MCDPVSLTVAGAALASAVAALSLRRLRLGAARAFDARTVVAGAGCREIRHIARHTDGLEQAHKE